MIATAATLSQTTAVSVTFEEVLPWPERPTNEDEIQLIRMIVPNFPEDIKYYMAGVLSACILYPSHYDGDLEIDCPPLVRTALDNI